MTDPNPGVSDGLPGTDAESGVYPEWLTALKSLGVTIAAAGSNPQAWLEGFIRTVVAEWMVGGILDTGAYVLGWIIFAFERTASILGGLAGILTSPLETLGDAAVGAIESLYAAALSVGLPSPLAVAFAVAVVGTVLAVVVFAVAKVLPGSDAIEGGLEALR